MTLLVSTLVCGCGGPPATTVNRPAQPASADDAIQTLPPAAPAVPDKGPEMRQEVSQHGITWTFDRPHPVGRFITGDWWVAGPVTIVSITPAPGPAPAEQAAASGKSRYGAVALQDDARMRNGSMIIADARLLPGKAAANPGEQQGYDSRAKNYHPGLSVALPCTLPAGQALVSSVSTTALTDKGEPSSPSALGDAGIFLAGKVANVVLSDAAVLTCVAAPPPADAFRPAYAGTSQRFHTASQLRTGLLPRLKPVAGTPDFARIARLFERPWLDHTSSWLVQHTMPGRNQPVYGREFARLTSLASLMLLLDVPEEQRRPLLIGYVQLGIDLAGLAQAGRQWFPDGGHWQGRKWPILFASLLLDDPALRAFPALTPGQTVYGGLRYQPEAGDAPATTLFQEDLDSYYGTGGDGQRVLWQICVHTGIKPPYEEKPRASHAKPEQFVDAYRANNLGSWAGAALAARLMRAQALWDHDAFFDLVDRWMRPDELFEVPKWYPAGCTRTVDPFVEQMWAAYRAQAPAQPGATTPPRVWVWNGDGRGGRWAANTPPAH